MENLKLGLIHFLLQLYFEQQETDQLDYDALDEFYASIGYDYESENLLHMLNINGTSDLLELFTDYQAFQDNDIAIADFSAKWLTVTTTKTELDRDKTKKRVLKGIDLNNLTHYAYQVTTDYYELPNYDLLTDDDIDELANDIVDALFDKDLDI